MARKDLLTRLADAGEEAIGKLGDTPGADRLLGVANTMRDRMDELQKRVRGLDELERRVTELERRLEAAEGAKRSAARKSASSTAAKSPAKSRAKKTS
jgi:uncharacterized protein involved in exopolysaccharide biosynthesis